MRLRTLAALAVISFLALLALTAWLKRVDGIGWGVDAGPTKVYFADHISPAHLAAIEMFNRLNAGRIEVVPVDLPFDKFSTNERKELLARSLRSKSEKLDIFAVDLIWVPRFARWGEPLEGYFTAEERRDVLPTALHSCLVNDTLVAMPMYIDVGLMYYRRDIIRRLPDADAVERRIQQSLTWDELDNLRRRLGYSTRPFYIFPAKDYEGLVCCFFERAVGEDPQFLEGNIVRLRSPAAHRSLEALRSFVADGTSPRDVDEFDENLSYAWFLDHDAVFVRGWPNFVENFRTFYGDSVKLAAVGRAPLPHVRGSKPASVFGGWNLMISRSSSKKQEAAEFIRFLQSADAQRLMFERGGYIPIRSSIYADTSYLAAHPELAFYHGLLERGFHRPALVEYTKMSDVLSHFLHIAVRGDVSPEAALRQADDMIRSNAVLLK